MKVSSLGKISEHWWKEMKRTQRSWRKIIKNRTQSWAIWVRILAIIKESQQFKALNWGFIQSFRMWRRRHTRTSWKRRCYRIKHHGLPGNHWAKSKRDAPMLCNHVTRNDQKGKRKSNLRWSCIWIAVKHAFSWSNNRFRSWAS